ncbi:helix-turn-helix domain-containing protein [Actinokineospora sp. PR83]|uniref:PucR family transcriptional regulator n=1 Tax=Actinokineospora sp. PR83 TaxID=2884908 RepID=UPI001F28E3F1|nr:helix-turn-helix domain-containing protein [Actinokineospora sp. PR83]MCG8914282.1 helix-turn-helix domain-containing protein [Actinokineospora sp. PR83]
MTAARTTAPAEALRLAAAARARRSDLVRTAVEAITRPAGPRGPADLTDLTATVTAAVDAGLDAVFDDRCAPPACLRLLGEVGAAERRAGRGLEVVESATRVATRAVWHHLVVLARRLRVPPATTVAAVDALFAFTDTVCEAARAGHRVAGESTDPGRAELLALLLAPAPVPDLTTRAAEAGWPLPDRVTALVADTPFRADPARVPPGALTDPDRASTCLLVPADQPLPEAPSTRRDIRFAAGPPVRTAEAHRSAHYARTLLDLVDRGTLPTRRLTRADDHLLALLTAADDGLLPWIRSATLAPLAALSPGRRAKLLTTLALWLRHDGDVREVAERVGLHPQTVRYRLQQLRDLLGDSALEGEQRFLLRLAMVTAAPAR